MKPRHKVYLKINLVSLFFVIVSFISVTLAWFAYSGLSNVATEIGVKAWYIELEKNGKSISNDIVISLSEIYPGMDVVNEVVNIKNMGDSDAELNYKIVSARILDNEKDNYVIDDSKVSSDYVEDKLSHEYPFHINVSLSKNYILAKGEDSDFEVSISWPLDSGSDTLDSLWGNEAYKFHQKEHEKNANDSNYEVRPAIQIVISVTAEQYLGAETSSDVRYNLGDVVLFDPVNNKVCTKIGGNCKSTYVIDVNNVLGDETVTLLPAPNGTYSSGTYDNYDSLFESTVSNWKVDTRALQAQDILKIISTDITNSFLIRNNISDVIIGSLKYNNRMTSDISRVINSSGYYRFINEKFDFLSSNNCYWTKSEYNSNYGFAVKKTDDLTSNLYNETKESTCNIIPVIIASKSSLTK